MLYNYEKLTNCCLFKFKKEKWKTRTQPAVITTQLACHTVILFTFFKMHFDPSLIRNVPIHAHMHFNWAAQCVAGWCWSLNCFLIVSISVLLHPHSKLIEMNEKLSFLMQCVVSWIFNQACNNFWYLNILYWYYRHQIIWYSVVVCVPLNLNVLNGILKGKERREEFFQVFLNFSQI